MSEFCLIISGAPECYIPVSFQKADYVIACDAGYIHAQRAGIVPDLVVGDFDSYQGMVDGRIREVIRTKPEKDDTDTMMAVKEALRLSPGDERLQRNCALMRGESDAETDNNG